MYSEAMARRIEIWPIEKLIPYARNPRTHSAAQVSQLTASIAEFGFVNPVLVASDAGIMAGRGRLLGAQELKFKEVPVIVLDHLTPAQRKAYLLADNKLAELAGWDEDLLRMELKDLQLEEFDLGVIGFSDEELAELLADDGVVTTGLTDEDAVPGVPERAVSSRAICGCWAITKLCAATRPISRRSGSSSAASRRTLFYRPSIQRRLRRLHCRQADDQRGQDEAGGV